MSDYQEAVQSPSLCFFDADLQAATPVCNKLGLPRPICGNFASVYEFEHPGGKWAIKCFLRNIPDLHKRYERISDHLKNTSLPYFCTFDYITKGIKVHGKPFPLVKMEWVAGQALNHYVADARSDPSKLEALEDRWLELLDDLKGASIAHTDLQHGNVIVQSDGALRLIDYDGMWVPKLKGQRANENGHPDYQSPLRTGKDFNADLDGFAGDVIHVALRALRQKPGLWDTYNNGDNLLFRRADFVDPPNSTVFQDLRALGDSEIDAMLDDLVRACGFKVKGAKIKKSGRVKKAEAAAAAAAAPPPPPPPPKAKAKPKAPAPATSGNVVKPSAPAPARPAAPPPRAPAPAPAAASGPAWLSGHVAPAGTAPAGHVATARAPARAASPAPARAAAPTPAPAPKPAKSPKPPKAPKPSGQSKPGSVVRWVRLSVYLLTLLPVAAALTFEMMTTTRSRGRVDFDTAVLVPTFSAVILLGLVAFSTLLILRSIHAMAARLFFSLVGIMMLILMVAGLLNANTFGWSGDDVWQSALMVGLLALSLTGLVVEPIAQRRC